MKSLSDHSPGIHKLSLIDATDQPAPDINQLLWEYYWIRDDIHQCGQQGLEEQLRNTALNRAWLSLTEPEENNVR